MNVCVCTRLTAGGDILSFLIKGVSVVVLVGRPWRNAPGVTAVITAHRHRRGFSRGEINPVRHTLSQMLSDQRKRQKQSPVTGWRVADFRQLPLGFGCRSFRSNGCSCRFVGCVELGGGVGLGVRDFLWSRLLRGARKGRLLLDSLACDLLQYQPLVFLRYLWRETAKWTSPCACWGKRGLFASLTCIFMSQQHSLHFLSQRILWFFFISSPLTDKWKSVRTSEWVMTGAAVWYQHSNKYMSSITHWQSGRWL